MDRLQEVLQQYEKDGYSYRNQAGEYVMMRYVDLLDWYLVIHGAAYAIRGEDVLPILLGTLCVICINLLAAAVCSKKQCGGEISQS